MNLKRLLLAVVTGFVFIFVSDILVHGVWLVGDYKATMQLWRPDAEMNARMPWMMAGQFLVATAFVVLWAVGFAERAKLSCAVKFGLFMGLFFQGNTLITYVVTPLPGALAAKWFVAGVGQSVLLGLVTFAVYKPLPVRP